MTILSETIRNLHLRPDSPYPSQVDTIVREAAQYFFSVLRLLQDKNIRAEVYRG